MQYCIVKKRKDVKAEINTYVYTVQYMLLDQPTVKYVLCTWRVSFNVIHNGLYLFKSYSPFLSLHPHRNQPIHPICVHIRMVFAGYSIFRKDAEKKNPLQTAFYIRSSLRKTFWALASEKFLKLFHKTICFHFTLWWFNCQIASAHANYFKKSNNKPVGKMPFAIRWSEKCRIVTSDIKRMKNMCAWYACTDMVYGRRFHRNQFWQRFNNFAIFLLHGFIILWTSSVYVY